jgi:hypothetical protein
MNFKGRSITDIEVEDIDTRDAPDFCDAYIATAHWKDTGEELSVAELEELNADGGLVYEATVLQLY